MGSIDWARFSSKMLDISKLVGYCPLASFKEVLGNKPSGKKRRYRAGIRYYRDHGVLPKHGRIQEMQKLEFFPSENLEGKEDRCIQYRDVTYNAALARQLHHVEHRLYASLKNSDGTPVILKGLAPMQRAIVVDHWKRQFKDPVFILADASRWDAHVNKELLAEEHRFYKRCRGYNPELVKLLKMQKKNIGFSTGGIVYRMKAKRMSGDYNTALGNSVLNAAMLMSIFEARVSDYRLGIDGDDSIGVIERAELSKLDDLAEACLSMGHEETIEVVDTIERAEFCQSRIVYTAAGPTFVRNPWKALHLGGTSVRGLSDRQARQWAAAKALCEVYTNPGVPVISELFRRVLKESGVSLAAAQSFKFASVDEEWKKTLCRDFVADVPVTDEARASFYLAWGIAPVDQIELERGQISWEFALEKPCRNRPGVPDSDPSDEDWIPSDEFFIDKVWVQTLPEWPASKYWWA